MPLYSDVKKNIIESTSKKRVLSLFIVLAIIFNLNQVLDDSSKQYVDKAFNRALISFGIAKTLNGVISVAQGTEVAIQPAGIGINFAPGQILDPVNDLIERFSWIMLASTTSLGIQKVFMTMSVWPSFRYLVVFILLVGLLLLFTKSKKYYHSRIFFLRMSLLLIAIRFAIPVTTLANEAIYHVFLEKEYVTSTQNLEHTAQEIGQLNELDQQNQLKIDEKSAWENAKDFYNSTTEMLDINKKIDKYKIAVKETTYHVVNLIVVFIFQTVIIPLLFIYILFVLFKYIVKIDFNF